MEKELKHLQELITWYQDKTHLKTRKTGDRTEIEYFATEAEMIAFLVIPFLKLLEYTEKQIMLEFHITGKKKRIDILVCDEHRKKPKMIIEVKKLGELSIKKATQQALEYRNDLFNAPLKKEFEMLDELKTIAITDGNQYFIYNANSEMHELIGQFNIEKEDAGKLNSLKRKLNAYYETNQ